MPSVDLQPEILQTLKNIERLLIRIANNTSKDGTFIMPIIPSEPSEKDRAERR